MGHHRLLRRRRGEEVWLENDAAAGSDQITTEGIKDLKDDRLQNPVIVRSLPDNDGRLAHELSSSLAYSF
ncbi:hypothetical protein NBG4_620004 [Candidatus Sulfobium mesophilum]|uniref:Uncharacterized protein n=1 Tax=Candidatus Sulfobium mesophilum TaxID=2016548 RepID=A0A2U3QJP2_9BACT|nr:hypothetical protein NBG4_620004 [Candidatus Sulfobium mesophilum]